MTLLDFAGFLGITATVIGVAMVIFVNVAEQRGWTAGKGDEERPNPTGRYPAE